MNVLPLEILVSLGLAAVGILGLLYSLSLADHEHADRLSLLPLEDEADPLFPIPSPKERQ